MGMAYGAARTELVLFGGLDSTRYLGDTWTWDGTDWSQHPAGAISLRPRSGPSGALVQVQGWGFAANEKVRLSFVDSNHGRTFLERLKSDRTGAFNVQVTIPATATPGIQRVKAKGLTSGEIAKRRFTVT
jgi:hypothetical protein